MSLSKFDELREIAGDVSRETFDSLVELDGMLHRWNARINLVAPSTVSESWSRHILDSAQLWPLLRDVDSVADLGSGGGFPGLVLGILLKARPNGAIRMVESNRKKTAFLQNVTGMLRLPAKIVPERIEIAVSASPAPQVITARALASLDMLFALAEPWFAAGAKGLFHKGRDYEREIEESSAKWRFDLIKHPSRIDAESVVLEISNVARIGAGR
ncbi:MULTISPECIES: 16S rRNA (guanine(527)-N(7))-methyltransferase RsmG [Mesorhizobium]|uniref:Ribosomal RNA small subunit methyltransferase G n=1 Tax=Mesorhizobium denitrificans TaxID=2294114 RepID=A0A371XGX2_9HYPH|nr:MULTISPECIES: 16S rRNA (guanine(527)-N(7))-methyltransferase RsmG [Mesorhizobium]RFC68477.1 16S rRNA (guanine(527)-N(7))-methyltransferase RsmG [Mesorhizobium denitrificans]